MGEYALSKYVIHPTVVLRFTYCLPCVCFFFFLFSSYTNVKAVHVNLGHRMWRKLINTIPFFVFVFFFFLSLAPLSCIMLPFPCTNRIERSEFNRWQSVAEITTSPSFDRKLLINTAPLSSKCLYNTKVVYQCFKLLHRQDLPVVVVGQSHVYLLHTGYSVNTPAKEASQWT